jgi:hypothetical protein
MFEKKNDNLPAAFFNELQALETRLIDGERQVPNWPWLWSLGVLAFLSAALLVADVAWFRILPTWCIYMLQFLAPTFGFAAVAFHQWPRLRVWKNANAEQKRTPK